MTKSTLKSLIVAVCAHALGFCGIWLLSVQGLSKHELLQFKEKKPSSIQARFIQKSKPAAEKNTRFLQQKSSASADNKKSAKVDHIQKAPTPKHAAIREMHENAGAQINPHSQNLAGASQGNAEAGPRVAMHNFQKPHYTQIAIDEEYEDEFEALLTLNRKGKVLKVQFDKQPRFGMKQELEMAFKKASFSIENSKNTFSDYFFRTRIRLELTIE